MRDIFLYAGTDCDQMRIFECTIVVHFFPTVVRFHFD